MLRNFIKPCFFCHSSRVTMSLSYVLFSQGHSWWLGLGKMSLFYCITYQESSHALNIHHHSKRFLFSPGGWGTGSLAEGSSVPHSRSHCTASKVVVLTFFYLFLIGGKLLYDVLLVSAVQQCESAVSIHISPLSRASLPSAHPVPLGHHRAPDWAACTLQRLLTSYLF